MDFAAIATDAVAFLAPYLAKFGEGAADKIGEAAPEAAGKLFGWMRTKLDKPGQEALGDLVAEPDNSDNQAVLRTRLVKALKADPTLAPEITALLPSDTPGATHMRQDVSGAGAKAAQVSGSSNMVNIG